MSLATNLSLALMAVMGLVGGCQHTPTQTSQSHATVQEHPIDGLSRDISENQTGAVRDNPTLSPPPVRRDFDR